MSPMRSAQENSDARTVRSFGEEWGRFDQAALSDEERAQIFSHYFSIFPWQELPKDAEGFDFGCGSGRWAALVAPRVATLNCIDASSQALAVARRNLSGFGNVRFVLASSQEIPLPAQSQDFGYSLGVLHHIPDTQAALSDCVRFLKPNAPFLVYLYYNFENRSPAFRAAWRVSDCLRRIIFRFPGALRDPCTDIVAAMIYFPLARLAALAHFLGFNVSGLPLAYYRDRSFYTMRTDARDRFGTPLEQRFSRNDIATMMRGAGLERIEFSSAPPFWCAVGRKKQ